MTAEVEGEARGAEPGNNGDVLSLADLARELIADWKLLWQKDMRIVYSEQYGEIRLTQAVRLIPETYKVRACACAETKRMKRPAVEAWFKQCFVDELHQEATKLPNWGAIAHNATVDPVDLTSKLAQWAGKNRRYDEESGAIEQSYFDWVHTVTVDGRWYRCHQDLVFGLAKSMGDDKPAYRQLAAQGDALRAELGYKHYDKMLNDLKICGLIEPGKNVATKPIRVGSGPGRRQYRVLII